MILFCCLLVGLYLRLVLLVLSLIMLGLMIWFRFDCVVCGFYLLGMNAVVFWCLDWDAWFVCWVLL